MSDEELTSQQNPVRMWGLIGGVVASVLFLLLFDLDPAHPEITRTAAVVLLMAVWWITDAIPLWATALLPVFLFPFFGIMSGKKVSSLYFNEVIFLFLGGFLVALCMERWNLHKRIALKILLFFGANPRGILLGFMTATAFLSMWVSNTASTMLMLPIIIAVILKLEESVGVAPIKKYAVGLLLGTAYSASIGGVATLVGTPPNPVLVKVFAINFPQAPEISFASWFAFALPVSVAFIAFVYFYLAWFFKPGTEISIDKEEFQREHDELGKTTFEEKVVFAVFTSLAILWLSRADINIGTVSIPGWANLFPNPSDVNDGTIAIAMATIFFLVPSKALPGERIADWDMVQKLPWGIILLFGGGFALASGFKDSGLSTWLGNQLASLHEFNPVTIVATISLMSTFITELTSNTATAQILLPILASLAVAIKLNPLLIMLPATMSVSFAFMLPVATPPNAIVFGAGRIRIIDMAKAGLILNIAGGIIITAAAFILGPIVFGIDLGTFPDWAVQK
ncbi:MAG: SLC13 family permease [Nitrospinota bacterium]|nr:SLC13 family permease [Nitrospinota bacterium]